MRSAAKAALLLLALCVACAGVQAAEPRFSDHLSDAEIAAGIDALRQDPNLVQEKKTSKTLRWKNSAQPRRQPDKDSWAVDFFAFLANSASLLIWTVGGVAVALALIWVLRVLRMRGPRALRIEASGVSHVQNLDVRPASLPADIGAAAAGLLAAGQIRDALSLLYRGALSRAIHRHGIAIAESSTEGEVLKVVSPHLAPPGAQYFTRLVALWQRAGYAAEPPASEAVAELCRDFPVLEGARV